MKPLRSILVGSRLIGVITLREDAPMPDPCETPQNVSKYYREKIATDPRHNRDVETVYVILLNRRNKVIGHHLVASGTVDMTVMHAREVFRAAIVAAAASVILLHNHPSGDPTPSGADITGTAQIVQAGHILRLEVLDHVVVADSERVESGKADHFSMRQSGLVAF